MRRIKKARITLLSLVPKGANRMPVIYKSDEGQVEFDLILKEGPKFDEQGELTAVVYASESRDSQGDIASAEVVKEMAYSFMKEGGQIDLQHDGKAVPKDKAFVAENFIVQKDDPRFSDLKDYDGEPVDATDAWAVVIKIEDPDLRKAYRDGKWNGVSMFGTAEVESDEKETRKSVANRLSRSLKEPKESNMTDDDRKEIANLITTTVKEVVKELLPAKEEKNEDNKQVQKEDDPYGLKALRKEAFEMKVASLKEEVDPEDPESVDEFIRKVEELESSMGSGKKTVKKQKPRQESRQDFSDILKSDDEDWGKLIAEVSEPSAAKV